MSDNSSAKTDLAVPMVRIDELHELEIRIEPNSVMLWGRNDEFPVLVPIARFDRYAKLVLRDRRMRNNIVQLPEPRPYSLLERAAKIVERDRVEKAKVSEPEQIVSTPEPPPVATPEPEVVAPPVVADVPAKPKRKSSTKPRTEEQRIARKLHDAAKRHRKKQEEAAKS